jgi:hypothetical protein
VANKIFLIVTNRPARAFLVHARNMDRAKDMLSHRGLASFVGGTQFDETGIEPDANEKIVEVGDLF